MLPNNMISAYLTALEDLLGENGVKTVLNLSGLHESIEGYPIDGAAETLPHSTLAKLQATIEDIYGERTGLNLSRKAARSASSSIGAELLNTDQPVRSSEGGVESIEEALDTFARLFVTDDHSTPIVSGTDERVSISLQVCPNCVGRESSTPICQAVAGWIEGLIELIGSSDEVSIYESSCLAVGDENCTFVVQHGQKEPVEG